MNRVLHVLLEGRHVGDVTQSREGSLTFAYQPAHLTSPASTPLSLSMPVAEATYRQRQVRAYLNGLLPDDDDVRERWGRRFGVNPANPAPLLRHMGLDCAGAVQFTEGDVDEAVSRTGSLEPLDDATIARRLRSLRRDTSGWSVPGDRWSLAGAQAKFALARTPDGRWHEPTGSAPSTHIIKPGAGGYRDQALNEHICLRACADLGVRAARTEHVEIGGEPALVVSRYDRVRTDTDVVRLHQEDLCQALAVPPKRKYETAGGPTVQHVVRLLRDAGAPEDDLYRFVDGVILNYLLGAPDAHAKNYSVLLRGGQVRLAPLYDVASALLYDAQTPDHELDQAAMAVGGERTFGKVTGRHWARLARSNNLDDGRVVDRVRDLAGRLPDAVTTASRDHSGDLTRRLSAAVARHAATTTAAL